MSRNRRVHSSILFNTASAVALIATGVCIAGEGAHAQGQADVEQVVVTGSRIGTPGFQTPTPVTEISPLQYEVKQITSVVELAADIPALTVNESQSSVVDVGASTFNLRNLGSIRTLTLINGLRTEATSVNGGFDINTLPASLIQHIDIVTGGASAAYGSDAVAGVVNVTLNTTLQGLRAKLGFGESYYGDDQTLTASVAWGTEFASGKGHLVLGGDFYRNQGVAAQNLRPWGRQSWGIDTNTACTTYTTTCTNLYLTTNVIASTLTTGGVITSGALKNIQFGPGGVLMPFTPGLFAGGSYAIGGSGALDNGTQSLQPTVGRDDALVNVDYDVSDNISAWVRMSYSRSTQVYPIIPPVDNGNLTISAQNAFIPAALATLLTANKLTTFVMGRSNTDLAPIHQARDLLYGRNEDFDPSAGFKGKFDALGTTWSWDINVEYASNDYTTVAAQNRRNDLWVLSVDSVVNPAVGGVAGVPAGLPVCRSTLTNPTNGCVPADVFGPGAISTAVTNYVTGTSWIDALLTMSDASFNFKGEPFSTWAGPVLMAVGGEYRKQTTHSITDQYSIALAWANGNSTPFQGHYSVEEGYLEFGIPLLKDSPIGKALDLDAAVRATSYSTSGGATTWKVGLNYSLNDDIRFRATRSHDLRAPSLQELFQNGILRCCSAITNPVTGVNAQAGSLTTGNPNLVPEVGDTITAGVVYSPSWLDSFNISIDYWHIKLTNQIITPGTQTIVNNCLQFNLAQYCPAIVYQNGVISYVAASGFNAASLTTDGWDFEVGYNFQMSDLVPGMGGTVQMHALASLLGDYVTNSFGLVLNTAGGISQSLPRLRSNITAIYLNDPWTVTVSGNWEGGGPFNALYNSTKYTYAQGARTINNNTINGRFYINLTASYQLNDVWQIYGKANNLLAVAPPAIPDQTPFQHAQASGTTQFDHIGGQWLVGVKISTD